MSNSSNLENIRFLRQNLQQQKFEWKKKFEKINAKIVISINNVPLLNLVYLDKKIENKRHNLNRYIAIYPCTKFQVIWRASDFGTKFAQYKWIETFFKK